MANSLFKTKQVGSSYVYVHVEKGNDITGTGTEANPYQSLTKAHSVYSGRIKLLRGLLQENISTGMTVHGDEMWQILISTVAPGGIILGQNLNFTSPLILFTASSFVNSIVGSPAPFASASTAYSIIATRNRSVTSPSTLKNCTVLNMPTTSTGPAVAISINSILLGNVIIAPSNQADMFSFTVFSGSSCTFYYKNYGVNPVIKPTWVADPYENMRRLKRAIDPTWSEFGQNTELDNFFGTQNINNQKIETCMVIADDGVISPRIFSDYEADGITPRSFYLNNDPNNQALYASETGSWVGALPPAQKNDIGMTVINVDPTTGADDGNGVLAYVDVNTLTNNADKTTYQGQTWNRISTPVFPIAAGANFRGSNSYGFSSGWAYGFYIGKKQTLFGTELQPSGGIFNVAANTMYKVMDSTYTENVGVTVTSGTTSNIYGSWVSFSTPEDLTGYMVTANSDNVYLVPVLNEAFESLEVYPYDDETTPAVNFPPFSSPINTELKVLYHRTGTRAGFPVLFSEVSTNVDPYFNNFAVSNADSIYFDLITDTVNYEGRDVSIYFCRVEVNVNYDKNLSNV